MTPLRWFRWIRRLLYLVVLAAFIYLVVSSAQVVGASRTTLPAEHAAKADAVVVIGTSPGNDLTLRCEDAVTVVRAGRAPVAFTTGPVPSTGGPSEAELSAKCLHSHGIAHVVTVPMSPIPTQLAYIARHLGTGRRVILVADPLQTKWLSELAASEGLHAQVVAVPAPKGSFFDAVGTIWGQSVALALGRIVGFPHTGWIGG